WRKLDSGRERPSAAELAALEFVIRMLRPAPLSTRGCLDPLPSKAGSNVYQADMTAAWERFRALSRPILYSVGRLDRPSGPDAEGIGTGFLVGEDLVVTNHHVLSKLSNGADALDEGMAVIRFYQEYQGPEPV